MKCPECANEISSQARTCPRCGYPLNIDKDINNQQMNSEENVHQYDSMPTSTKKDEVESKASNKGLWGFIIAVVLLVILLLIFQSTKSYDSILAGNTYSYKPSRYQMYMVEFGQNVLILSDNRYKADSSSISGLTLDSLKSSKKSYEYSRNSENQITCNGKTYTFEINPSNDSITFSSKFLDLAKSWDIWHKRKPHDVGPKVTIEDDEPFIKGDESYDDLKSSISFISILANNAQSRIEVEAQVGLINELVNEIYRRFPEHKSDVKYRSVSDFWP